MFAYEYDEETVAGCSTADSGPTIAPALEIEQVHVTGDADANNPRKADLVNRTIQDGITYAREVPMPEGMLPCGQCRAVPIVADHVGRIFMPGSSTGTGLERLEALRPF